MITTKQKMIKTQPGVYQYRGFQIQHSISDPGMWIMFFQGYDPTKVERWLSGNVSSTLRGAKRRLDRVLAEGL